MADRARLGSRFAAAVLAAAGLVQARPATAQEASTDSASSSIVAIDPVEELAAEWGTGPVDPATRVCLAKDQVVLFASDRVTFQVAGEACATLADAEAEAFANSQRALEYQAYEVAVAEYDAAIARGDEAAKESAYARYAELAQNLPEGEWVDDVAKAQADAIAMREAEERMLNAPLSAGPPAMPPPIKAGPPLPPRPIIFRLASGSPSVIARFPRGMIVQPSTALCLTQGEQLTVSSSIGQSTTYTGPGCLKRQGKPTRENIGAFVFG